MEHVKTDELQLDTKSAGWWEAIEAAKLREQGRRARWERHYQHQMSYDEFVFRENLQIEVDENRMIPIRAQEVLKEYLARNQSTKHEP